MLDELLAYSRQQELDASERKIAFRQEYERTRRVERLELELAVARARASLTPRTVNAA